jgi:hypothetical protein
LIAKNRNWVAKPTDWSSRAWLANALLGLCRAAAAKEADEVASPHHSRS